MAVSIGLSSPVSIEEFLLLPLIKSAVGWHPKLGLCRTETRALMDEQGNPARTVEASFPMPKEAKARGDEHNDNEGNGG